MNEERINELYDIACRLKSSYDERVATKAVLAKNPSSAMHQRYEEAKGEHTKALYDFGEFIAKYVKDDDIRG
jgi:hypothetical protein